MIERHLLTLYLRETRDWLSLSDVIVCRFSFLFPITFTFCTSHLTFSSSWWDCKEGRKCSIQLSWLLPLILQWEYNREEEKKMQSRVTGVTLANSRRHRRSRENQSTEPPLNEDHNNYQVIKTLGTRSRLPEGSCKYQMHSWGSFCRRNYRRNSSISSPSGNHLDFLLKLKAFKS